MNKIKMILPIILAFVLVFGSCLTVSAATLTSEPLDSSVEDIIYSYLNKNYSSYEWKYILYCGDVAYVSTDTMYSDGNNFYIKNDSVNRKLYFSGNTITKSISTSTDSNKSIIDNTSCFCTCGSGTIYINNDITDGHGNVVFRRPVVPIAQKAEELPEMVNNQIAVILTIAVACLALLVTLSVLRKKLPSFL